MFNPRSIISLDIAKLESRIAAFEKKLADPADPDDKKWTMTWLTRCQRELEKKQKGMAFRERERSTPVRRTPRVHLENQVV